MQHFQQFDEELQDSDQTISTSRPSRVRRLSTAADVENSSSDACSRPLRRRFPISAFFSDTTDDDVSRPMLTPLGCSRLSLSAYSRHTSIGSKNTLLHTSTGRREGRRCSEGQEGTMDVPRLHVDAVQFPMTRSVLWDRRRLSNAPAGVSLEQVLPQFVVSVEASKEVYRVYGEKSGVRGSGAALCYLYGDATSLKVKKVLLKGVKLKKKDARAAGTWCIPVHAIAEGNKPEVLQEHYVATIAAVQSSYRDEYSDNVATKLQLKLLIFRSSPHDVQLDFQLDCAASPVLFKFSLIRNLPLLMTPLAVSLARREFSTQSGNMRSGYLTLDRTRKAVPLLKVDPLVLHQPLVGIWVYGVQIDDAWDEEIARQQLADPLLYFACIGYLVSEVIKDRVGPEENTFLVALYPASNPGGGGSVGSLPRFFECDFSAFLTPRTRLLPIELYSHRLSCLVGASKFLTDLELTLSTAPTSEWEAARRQAKIPTAPRSKGSEDDVAPSTARTNVDSTTSNCLLTSTDKSPYFDDEDEHKGLTGGWTITADAITANAICNSSGPDLNAQSQTSMQSEKKNSSATISAGFGVAKVDPAMPLNGVHKTSCAQAATTTSYVSPSNETEDAAQRDWNDSNSLDYRSCCKSQQLLTIQHQQILENQQRQLHEMQEQIVQLRGLLDAAKSEKKIDTKAAQNDESGNESDANSSGIGEVPDVSDVSGTFGQHENGDSQSPIAPTTSATLRRIDNGSFSDKPSIQTHQNDENVREGDGKELSLSSLGLSSISCSSAADLSSLSSSLASKQLNDLTCSRGREKTTVDGEHVESGAQDLNQSQLSEDKAEAKKQNRTVQANNNDIQAEEFSETVSDAREGIDNATSSHDLFIDELSTSLRQEVLKNLDRIGVALDDDGNVNASGDDHSAVERLLSPDAYLRKVGGFVDHHGGCFTTPPLDFHSFCVPRIKFSSEAPECDSDDEEIRLIEQKYKRLMAA